MESGHLPGSVMTMPEPRRGESAADLVTRTLTERIESGQYPAGSLLPYSRELQAEFGLKSDMAIRTAVTRLKARGLLVHVPGVGTAVAESPPPITTG